MADVPFSRILHRETVRLLILIGIAVVTAFVTRAIAREAREIDHREAAQWFVRGQLALERGDTSAAVTSFRRAAMKRRGEKSYALALADALLHAANLDAAERVLVAARESSPEDPSINLALAKVAADRGDVTTAVRFYHNAIYAPWQSAEAPRSIRLALVRLLVEHKAYEQAISELIAATTDLPSNAEAHLQVGALFAAAGDERHALEQFTLALAVDPKNADAFTGAGHAAFELGHYEDAGRYLRAAPADRIDREELTTADLVVTRDPLASRITSPERRRRLTANLTHAKARVQTCLTSTAPDQAARLLAEIDGQHLDRRRIPREADELEAAVNLISRAEQQVLAACPAEPLDRALLLIAERHGVGSQ